MYKVLLLVYLALAISTLLTNDLLHIYFWCRCFSPNIPHSSIDTYFTKKVSFQTGPSCKVAHRSISRIDMHRKCRSPPIFEISHHRPSSKVPGGTLTSLLPVQKVRAFNLYNHRHTCIKWWFEGGHWRTRNWRGERRTKLKIIPAHLIHEYHVPCTLSGLSNKAYHKHKQKA